MSKIVLVKRKTRLDGLVARFNSVGQVKFLVESQGQDFTEYQKEHDRYYKELDLLRSILSRSYLVQEIDREFLPNFIFGPQDTVIAMGQDGLVANTLKYLDGQPLLGVNPDPVRWDGMLLPFRANQVDKVVDDTLSERRPMRKVMMAEAALPDGQSLRAVNDFFIGQRSHVSFRYTIAHGDQQERQSSSGVIVSTGLGSTGWYRSIMVGAGALVRAEGRAKKFNELHDYSFPWDSEFLRFSVREPFPSRFTGVSVVSGEIRQGHSLVIRSETPEGGVIFSDGVEQDAIEFNAGQSVEVKLSGCVGKLVI